MASLAQRPRIGLKDVVYTVLDESTDVVGGTPTYGTIYSLANAIDLSFDPGSSVAPLFADDGLSFAADTVGEMKISFGTADLLPEHIARILGHTYSAGQIIENVLDQSPYIAIGAKLLRAGKDVSSNVYEYLWMYKVKLSKPKFDAKTKAATIEYQTPMLEGLVTKLTANGNYRIRMRTDDPAADTTTLANFFTAVVFSGADLTALSVAIAKGTAGDSGKIVCSFTKGSSASHSLVAASVTSTSVFITDETGGKRAGAYVTSTAGTTTTVKFTPTVAFASESIGTVVNGVQDNSGVTVTSNGIALVYP